MIFGRGTRHDDEGPDPARVEDARARYVLRTAKPPVLERVVAEVDGTLTEQARAEWVRRLTEEGVTVHQPASLGLELVDAIKHGEPEMRSALARSATEDVVAAIGRATSAAPAFAGFLTSPEAQEIGMPDPDAQIARGRRRVEPPYLPGTNAGGRR